MELFILSTPNFHSWQSLSRNSSQCGESLLRGVGDGNQLNSTNFMPHMSTGCWAQVQVTTSLLISYFT